MKIVEPQVELWKQEPTLEGAWHQIARATRVCYQSKPRKGESSEDFVKRIIFKPALIEGNLDDLEHCKFDFDKMHGAMLEHGTVYLDIDSNLKSVHELFVENPYSKVTYDNYAIKDHFFVTTNMRVIIENNLFRLLKDEIADAPSDWIVDVPTKYHTKRYTFSIITDIGVTREMNRHRKFSVAEQSTRYCSYNADKFGGEITYVAPAWINDRYIKNTHKYDKSDWYITFKQMCKAIVNEDDSEWNGFAYYYFGLISSEFAYIGMKHKGDVNDKCRQVLNLNTKTQAVYTAFVDDWNHFLKLRADNVSGKAHPNMQLIAKRIQDIIETL